MPTPLADDYADARENSLSRRLLQNELEEVEAKLTDTEGELDITIAALTARGGDGDDSQATALKRVRGNLSKGIYKQLDGLRGNGADGAGPEDEERRKNLVMVGAWHC